MWAAIISGWSGLRLTVVSIHAARVGRDAVRDELKLSLAHVSIHAARVGRDRLALRGSGNAFGFNPRGPCGPRCASHSPAYRTCRFNPRGPCGPRSEPAVCFTGEPQFQSTRPVWAAISTGFLVTGSRSCFNPRGPCGPRYGKLNPCLSFFIVSIHAARVGRDSDSGSSGHRTVRFNPRGPCGPRSEQQHRRAQPGGVSIHAARVGRDSPARIQDTCRKSFNPRGPCGPRFTLGEQTIVLALVSIHAARVGRD